MNRCLAILGSVALTSASESEWAEEIPAAQRRRTPRIWRMALAATGRLFKTVETRPRSVVIASGLGALDETREFLDGVFLQNAGAPRNFIASVHNSMAGRLALEYGITGPNLTLCDGQNSFASAVGSALLLDPADLPVLLIVVDENTALLNALAPDLSEQCADMIGHSRLDGAAAFLLGQPAANSTQLLCAEGPAPASRQLKAEALKDLSARSSWGAFSTPSYDDTIVSFLQPAMCLAGLISAKTAGHHVMGSYSPSAQAAAIVDVCL